MSFLSAWQQKAASLKTEVYALYLAYRDPRTPWYAKIIMAAVIGYFLCPIDLIPDFIPVLGYLDDLVIVPGGILLATRMIPHGVMQECRERARTERISSRAKWVIAVIIVAIWLAVAVLLVRLVFNLLGK